MIEVLRQDSAALSFQPILERSSAEEGAACGEFDLQVLRNRFSVKVAVGKCDDSARFYQIGLTIES